MIALVVLMSITCQVVGNTSTDTYKRASLKESLQDRIKTLVGRCFRNILTNRPVVFRETCSLW